MQEVSRRDFIRNIAIGGAVLSIGNAVFQKPLEALASGKYEIGQCKRVTIKCVSELGWFDSQKLISEMKAAGGPDTSQWEVPWSPENAAGSCSLIDMETLDGKHHKILLDAGWNTKYMDECFKREGIDQMLKNREIDFLMISHEHLDHLWGLETVLKYDPEIRILIPGTFYSEGMHFLKGAEFITPAAKNSISHKGELVQLESGKVSKVYEGCAAVAFDLPILLRVRGEQSLYFNVKGKGMVCVTGCCHQTILTLADFAQDNIVGGENLYGVYGGLHIAPFGPMNPEREHIVKGMGKYNFRKVACNHCTGLAAVQRMVELGYPIVKGSGKHGSVSDLYIGNGDEVAFG